MGSFNRYGLLFLCILALSSCAWAADGAGAVAALTNALNSYGQAGQLVAGLLATTGVNDRIASTIDSAGNATVFLPENSALIKYLSDVNNLLALVQNPIGLGQKLILVNIIPGYYVPIKSINLINKYPTLLSGQTLKFAFNKKYYIGPSQGPIKNFVVIDTPAFVDVSQVLIVYRTSALIVL
eukprot:TRINITY_DN494_c0_g1_i2.p1 TRINITY_DN494_c0_g1~~TRINITY_DN494_c0_g1_i2.p1  ORF type:complete len:182 (+),score=4.67 TRINITY_DN494_c0_g1_i2:76-621(+)